VTVDVAERGDVRVRAQELQLTSLGEFSILPDGFWNANSSDELQQAGDASTLRKIFSEAGLSISEVRTADRLPTTIKKSAEWVGPTLFVGAAYWSQNPTAVQLAPDLISSYLVDLFRRRSAPSVDTQNRPLMEG
jgi:hypothetical protein